MAFSRQWWRGSHGQPVGTSVTRHHCTRVDALGLYRVWRTTRAHHVAASTVRRGPAMAERTRFRRRGSGDEPPAGSGVDPTGYLLCMALAWRRGRAPRRRLLHRAGPGTHPDPVGTVSRSSRPDVDPRDRGRCGRRHSRRGAQSRVDARPRESKRHGDWSRGARSMVGLPRGGRRCGGHRRFVPGGRARRVRVSGDRHPARATRKHRRHERAFRASSDTSALSAASARLAGSRSRSARSPTAEDLSSFR